MNTARARIGLLAVMLGLWAVTGARGTDWNDMGITCALCGNQYESPFPAAYSRSGGIRLDFQPMGSSRAPWPLATCPACGFIQYTHELTTEEKEILTSVVHGEDYKALTQTRPSYFRLAKLYEALGKSDYKVGDAYLKASWQEERGNPPRGEHVRECLAASLKHFAAYLAQGPHDASETLSEGAGCFSTYQMAQLLKAELLRRLRRFDVAMAYLGLLEKLPECQGEPVAEIIRFQKRLCGAKDSRPQYLQMREWYENSLKVRQSALPDGMATGLPVRWTAAVAMESLEEADAAMDRPLRKLKMSPPGAKDESNQRLVQTGREWLTAKGEGYFAFTPLDRWIEEDFIFHYMPMLLLRDHARPSRVSFVGDVEWGDDLAGILPVTIHPDYKEALKGRMAHGRAYPELSNGRESQFETGGPSLTSPDWPRLSEVFDKAKTETLTSQIALVLDGAGTADGKTLSLRIMAWADFNEDGVEDLLVTCSASGDDKAGPLSRLLLLTRLESGGPLLELPMP